MTFEHVDYHIEFCWDTIRSAKSIFDREILLLSELESLHEEYIATKLALDSTIIQQSFNNFPGVMDKWKDDVSRLNEDISQLETKIEGHKRIMRYYDSVRTENAWRIHMLDRQRLQCRIDDYIEANKEWLKS